jgi:hypothetical protein
MGPPLEGARRPATLRVSARRPIPAERAQSDRFTPFLPHGEVCDSDRVVGSRHPDDDAGQRIL